MNFNQLSDEQLGLARQWFDAVQDLNSSFLKKEDYILAKSIYEYLGLRVPNSINEVAICSSKKEVNDCSFKPEQPGVYLLRSNPSDHKWIKVGVMWMNDVLATTLFSRHFPGTHVSVDDISDEWEWKTVLLSEDVDLINQHLFST